MRYLMRALVFCIIAIFSCLGVSGQSFQDRYNEFKNRTLEKYEDYRRKTNAKYAEFLKGAWESFNMGPAVKKPQEDMVPPIVVDEDNRPKIDDNQVVIDEVVKVPAPEPQPQPIEPIKENERSRDNTLAFTLYGSNYSVRIPEKSFSLKGISPNDISAAWRHLSTDEYDNTAHDCLSIRDSNNLSDWAYLRLIDALSDTYLGKDTSESELLKAYIYSQSGYRMRLARKDNQLMMLYASPYIIYDKLRLQKDGLMYYSDFESIGSLQMCDIKLPNERAMSINVPTQQKLGEFLSDPKEIVSKRGVSASASVNKGLLEFCEDFPTSQYGDDPMTRWAIYANTPSSQEMRENLYPQLRQAIEGLSTYDAVNLMCNWVQTGFEYGYDDQIWGGDRAFFADETLYYPYCDCEDRSILLTRIVRDLLGLDCALIYYPGHLATAIAIGEDAKGDHIRLSGKKFLICDPTYINASIGLTMPGMDNSSAKAIILN